MTTKTRPLPRKYGQLTPANLKKFLRELEKVGSLKAAAAYVGVTPQAIYNAYKRYPDLKERVEVARNKASHAFETELRRRAVDGVEEDVYNSAGELVGIKKKYSDQLLIVLLKANDPERFGDLKNNFKVEHTHNMGASSESLNKLASLLKVSGIQPTTDELDSQLEE